MIIAQIKSEYACGRKSRCWPCPGICPNTPPLAIATTHIQISDPGHLEGNCVFTYLDAFSKPEHFEEYLPEYHNLDELKEHYTRGGLGDVKIKKFLNNVIQEELAPIRARRAEFEKDIPAVYEILKKGSDAAREVAAQTLSEVKQAMKINYFDDEELIRVQSEKYQGV